MVRWRAISLVLAVITAACGQTPDAGPSAKPSLEPYTVALAGTRVEVAMVPIPVGSEGYPTTVTMGSPSSEIGRLADEGPTVQVTVEPFWIGRCEITWDTFDEFRKEYAVRLLERLPASTTPPAAWADAVSLPTPLWEQDSAPILEGLGTVGGYPAADITQFAARQFTKWLSKRTGHFYRLPTEAEWEYAARAGTTTAYSFGDDASKLGEYAWTFDNSAYENTDHGYPGLGAGYRKVGTRKPNPWGLHDVHGNVAEWVIDRHTADGYSALAGRAVPWLEAINWPKTVFPCVARGGSWESEPTACRSASRMASKPEWQGRDPQIPKSVWWCTDAFHVGFRILRPVKVPDADLQRRFWGDGEFADVERILRASGKQSRIPLTSGR